MSFMQESTAAFRDKLLDFLQRRSIFLATLLAILSTSTIISTYSIFSFTWDEPAHLAAGMELLSTGEYRYERQHPPFRV